MLTLLSSNHNNPHHQNTLPAAFT